MSNNDETTTTHLLVDEEHQRDQQKWVDEKEAKSQIIFSLPMILTNVFYYMIPLVSVMFAGHLGPLQLAASTLANSWATVTGFAFMVSFYHPACPTKNNTLNHVYLLLYA